MNIQQFYNSFFFKQFAFDKPRHTDNATKRGALTHYIGHLLRGSAKLIGDHRTIILKAGDSFYIPLGCRYHSYWYPDEQGLVQWNSLGFHYFPDPGNQSYLLQKLHPSEAGLAVLEQVGNQLNHGLENIGLLYSFLSDVIPSMQPLTDFTEQSVQKAVAFMRTMPHARMPEIARHCGISESALYSAFQNRLGTTPNTMRQRILCDKAQELLVTTDLAVEEISNHLGFSSSSYFRKVLYKHTGKTPLKIRKESSF